jgi:DHA1 family bicyclomycin/chloramphenicol resistance-like MFS transporter
VYVDLYGVTLAKVGLYILSLMLGLSAGAIVAGRIAGRWPIARIALAASALGLAAALVLLAQALAGTLGALSITASMMGMVFANGLLIPNSLAGAMETDERFIAAAGGLAGFLTQGTGVLCTLAVSLWYGHSALPMVCVLVAANTMGFAVMSWGLSGNKEPRGGTLGGKKPRS